MMIQIIRKAFKNNQHGANGSPKHVLVLAATPSLTGHLDVVLSRCKELRDIKRGNTCLQI
jgi:hypothetical protein